MCEGWVLGLEATTISGEEEQAMADTSSGQEWTGDQVQEPTPCQADRAEVKWDGYLH